MSTKITVEYPLFKQYKSAIDALMLRLVVTDPNWSGASYTIVAGDFTEVDTDDEIQGAYLLGRIHALLSKGAVR
jgi:hypothetical protein